MAGGPIVGVVRIPSRYCCCRGSLLLLRRNIAGHGNFLHGDVYFLKY